MKFKKAITMLIAFTLLLSIAGCTRSGESSTSDTTKSAATVVEKSSLKGPGQETPLEFKVMFDAIMWTKNNLDINASTELKKWSEYSNTKLSFFTPPTTSYKEKFNIMLASGDLPDVIITNDNTQLAKLLDADAIVKMDDLFKKYGAEFTKQNENKGWKKCKISGSTYAIPVYGTFYAQYGFIARKDWLDNLGLGLPKTLNDYYEVLKAFKNNDPDKNGANDTYGISFLQNSTSMGFLRSFGVDSNKNITYDYVNGELIPQQTQEKYKKYLEFERKLWAEGIYTPNSIINTSDQWKKEVFTGVAGMWFHQTYRIDEYFMTQFRSVQGKDTKVELVALEPPTGTNGEKSAILTDPVGMMISINKKAKDIESIFNYYMWLFTDKNVREYAKWGLEGMHHTVVNGKKQWINEVMSNDTYNRWKELLLISSNTPIDDEEIAIRYGERGAQNHNLNVKYGKFDAVEFVGKPVLDAESNYPDIHKIVLEYTTKIISGELALDAGFNDMVKRLNAAGLKEVTAAIQEWYKKNN